MAPDLLLRSRLLNAVDQRQDELIDLASRLIQLPTENPPGRSGPITDLLAEYLEGYGIPSQRLVAPGEHHNLVARIGSGPSGRGLILCGHSDVVPAGDPHRWSFDPFSGEVQDGYLLGRGASDMKAGLAGLLFAFALLKQSGVPLPAELTLAVADDEETGGQYGARWLLDNGHVKGSACLIAEPSSPFEPTIGQKGSAWFRLTLTGRAGHGSLAPLAGESAVLKAAKATLALQRLFEMGVDVPEELQEVVTASKAYMARVRSDDRMGALLDHVSVNVGVMQGGVKANMVPDRAVLEVDVRVPFGLIPDQVSTRVTELLLEEGLAEGRDYTVEPMGFRGPPNWTVPAEPVVQAVLQAIAEVRGTPATGVLQWASSDARFFRQHAIPVLQYGPADLPSIHAVDERVAVSEVVACTKVYILAILNYLGI